MYRKKCYLLTSESHWKSNLARYICSYWPHGICGNICRKSTSVCIKNAKLWLTTKQTMLQTHISNEPYVICLPNSMSRDLCVCLKEDMTCRQPRGRRGQENNPKLFMHVWHFACDSQRLTLTSICAEWLLSSLWQCYHEIFNTYRKQYKFDCQAVFAVFVSVSECTRNSISLCFFLSCLHIYEVDS